MSNSSTNRPNLELYWHEYPTKLRVNLSTRSHRATQPNAHVIRERCPWNEQQSPGREVLAKNADDRSEECERRKQNEMSTITCRLTETARLLKNVKSVFTRRSNAAARVNVEVELSRKSLLSVRPTLILFQRLSPLCKFFFWDQVSGIVHFDPILFHVTLVKFKRFLFNYVVDDIL